MHRLLALILLAAACSTSSPSATPTPLPDGDAGDAAAPVIIDPALFDCTSLAKPPLARRAASTPECLRDPKCAGRFVSAHRGAGGDLGRIAPEDTLAAYRAGIALGVDIVETDPRPTADGVLVNIHDTTVDRTTDGTGEVSKMTFDELRKLHVKSDRVAGDFGCERVPTLEELLTTCRGRALVLVDANKSDRVEAMVDAIRKADALEWAVFDTDDLTKIDRALALEPRLMIQPRVQAAADVGAILAKYASHLPVFVEISSEVFPKAVTEVHAAGTRVLTDVFIADLGVRSGADRKVYLDFFTSGADALQSDLPDEVLGVLGRPTHP
ncbi:glycerophosphodiester phosphodiesterase family protein [soil metagenome]